MSNQNPKLALEFNIEDIPWLLHAFSIQRTTCMTYGREGKKTQARVIQFIEQIKQFYPILANREIEEYKFFDAIMKLYECKTWSLYQEKPRYKYEMKHHWWKPVVIVCDDREYEVTSTTTDYSEPLVLGLIELCKQIAPITAEYKEHPSIQQPIKDSMWD